MSEQQFDEILRMFDIFVTTIENPIVFKEMRTEDALKSFQCAQFIEFTISRACEIGKENALQNNLHKHWLKQGKSNFYKCSEFKKACDKLLEVYSKDDVVSIDMVDELFKLYVQHCGNERLNEFLKRTLFNGVCTNVIIESLEKLGIDTLDVQLDALIMSWELSIGRGEEDEVSDRILKAVNDGFHSRLVQVAVGLQNNSKIKELIIAILRDKLVKNDVNVCLALVDLKGPQLCKLMTSNWELYMNFLNYLFCLARSMERVDNHWVSECEFEYEHLVKVIEMLLAGPPQISKVVRSRMKLIMKQSSCTIWRDIQNDIR